MIEQNLPNGNVKDASSGNLDAGAASVKMGGPDNDAYAGVPQSDEPEILNKVGDIKMEVETRSRLADHLIGVWTENKSARESNGIDRELDECLEMFNKQYTAKESTEIAQRGFPLVFFPLATHKVHTANAWIDEFFTNGETLLNVKPTPVPELEEDVNTRTLKEALNDIAMAVRQTGQIPPPEMVMEYAAQKRQIVEQEVDEEAVVKAHRIEKVLHDDLVQGKWSKAIHDTVCYMCLYGTAGLRSPVLKKRTDLVWKNGKVETAERVFREFEAVSPIDIFPSPGMTDTQRGDLCIRLTYYPADLAQMRGNAMWFDEAINKTLEKYAGNGLRLDTNGDTDRERMTAQMPVNGNISTIQGFEFFGHVSGNLLHSIGLTEVKRNGKTVKIEDTVYDFYHINAIVMGDEVVYCNVLMDGEERNIDVVKFFDTPGKFFGEGPLQLIKACQKICNSAGRSLVTNMGWASMPQGMVDLASIDPTDDLKMRPGKLWATRTNGMNPNAKPVQFFSVESNVEQFLKIFEFYMRLADEVSGIPAYANGTDATTGAARTATGLNMLMGQANRGIKYVVGNIDTLCKKAMLRLHRWHMLYNPDESIKGDVFIEVTGLKYFTTKTARANDLLNLINRITQDPRMMQLQSLDKLAKLMREIAVSFDLDPDSLAPALDEIRRMEAQTSQQQREQTAQANAQAQSAQDAEVEQINAEAQAKIAAQNAGAASTTPTGQPSRAPRPKEGGTI